MAYQPIPQMDERLVTHFWNAVQKAEEGCWLWKRAVSVNGGYGVFSINCKQFRAHRVAYSLTHGSLRPDMSLDHLCRNTKCVNPAHLEAVSIGTNVLRGNAPTAINARKTNCKNGHAFSESNTALIRRKDGGISRRCRICAASTLRKLRAA